MNKFSSYKNEKAPDSYRDDKQILNTFSEEIKKAKAEPKKFIFRFFN